MSQEQGAESREPIALYPRTTFEPLSAWVTLGCLFLLTVQMALMVVGFAVVVGWVL